LLPDIFHIIGLEIDPAHHLIIGSSPGLNLGLNAGSVCVSKKEINIRQYIRTRE